jgi:hypothetical protein
MLPGLQKPDRLIGFKSSFEDCPEGGVADLQSANQTAIERESLKFFIPLEPTPPFFSPMKPQKQ